MRIPSFRIAVEWTLRAVGIVLIAVLLWRSVHPPARTATATSNDDQLTDLLPTWTTHDTPDSIVLHVGQGPDASDRDGLVALRRNGSVIGWHADSLAPSAMTAEPIVDPQGGVVVRVGTPRGVTATLLDNAGVVDSATSRTGIATFRMVALAGDPFARVRMHDLVTSVRDSLMLRRLLVLGRVGWEAKFTIAALEERGWKVDARMVLAPGQAVTQGTIGSIDTARYAAVVVLDTSAVSNTAAILRYVNDGGGVVIAGSASGSRALSSLLPGRAGPRVVPRQRLSDTSETDGVRYPIVELRSDALVLDRDGSIITAAARRSGAGRVIQLADEETWRRRMNRAPGSVEQHRAWWTRIIGSVAYAPRIERGVQTDDAAPVAALVGALGSPLEARPAGTRSRDSNQVAWMFAMLTLALLAEWASRRWRGAP